jgi:hypothetical protein
LGEFSPTGRLFSLASLLKMTEVLEILGLVFSTVPVDKKLFELHTFWATFLQTNLVTLPIGKYADMYVV